MVPVYSCDAKFELQCLSEKREQSVGNSNIEYDKKDKSVQKKMVMLDLQEDFPNTEYYSSKLRNDDEIAATLFRLHGADSWAWHHMSKRLKKKYKIEGM